MDKRFTIFIWTSCTLSHEIPKFPLFFNPKQTQARSPLLANHFQRKNKFERHHHLHELNINRAFSSILIKTHYPQTLRFENPNPNPLLELHFQKKTKYKARGRRWDPPTWPRRDGAGRGGVHLRLLFLLPLPLFPRFLSFLFLF